VSDLLELQFTLAETVRDWTPGAGGSIEEGMPAKLPEWAWHLKEPLEEVVSALELLAEDRRVRIRVRACDVGIRPDGWLEYIPGRANFRAFVCDSFRIIITAKGKLWVDEQRRLRAECHGIDTGDPVGDSIVRSTIDQALTGLGGNHRDLSGDLLERYITGDRWGQDNGSGHLSRRHFYAYRRLHPRIWAWTLNTKADSVYHYRVLRALAVREFARLQSFPDRFVFTTDPRRGALPGRHDGGAAHSRYRQVGNAVPPLLARAVAEALRGSLASEVSRPARSAVFA